MLRADLHDVGVLVDDVGVRGVQQLGDDGQAGLGPRLGQDLQAGDAQALERERRGAGLERAAAQHRRAGGLDRVGDLQRLLAGLDRARPGDQRERLPAADAAAADVEHGRLVVAELGGRELVGPGDRHDAVDAAHALQAQLGDALGVADRADRGRQLAGHHAHVHARGLQPLDDGIDLGRRRLWGHHDHHGPSGC
jgi:hypothetical protein